MEFEGEFSPTREDDEPMWDYHEGNVHDLPNCKDIEETFHAMRKHQKGQEYSYPSLHSMSSKFLTLIAQSIGDLVHVYDMILTFMKLDFQQSKL